MYVPLVIVHVIVAVALILIVLLQAGKGAALGAAFGGASQTVFGPRGPGSFLGKLTTAAAGIFMVTSLVLAIFSSQRVGGSVVLSTPVPNTAAPAATAAGAPQSSRGAETTPSQREGAETTHQ
ncbi:MAG: preprotein translocase subunit SecG [Nitrospinae bacterium]|nr:preprotein translocase subunit SecG [Nitrospinota bacterium]